MHNGKDPYAGAVECIDRIAEAGKTIVSSSPGNRSPKVWPVHPVAARGFEVRVTLAGEVVDMYAFFYPGNHTPRAEQHAHGALRENILTLHNK